MEKGKRISHYEIIERVGGGGMGVVYRARDHRLARDVALKFLPSHLASEDRAGDRFMQEAQAASALDNPHICTIYDVGRTEDGELFIAMAYYRGKTLKALVENGPVDLEKAVDLIRQVATGLAVAHENDILHRDIKPGNIIATPDGVAKIIDFGLAKLVGEATMTTMGKTLGTAAYMSPEQVRGEQLDARTDIWSLGAVFYELLTGSRPFRADYIQAAIYSILNEDPPAPSALVPAVPSAIDAVVSRCLQKKRDNRYPEARTLADDLQSYSASGTVQAITVPAQKSERRRSLAVVDFANIVSDETVAWLCSGIAETVTSDLKRLSLLNVVGRDQVYRALKEKSTSITESEVSAIGAALGVDFVVWGAFQKMGDAVRITAHVSETTTGAIRGSTKVDGSVTDIFALQDRIVSALAESLDLNVTTRELERVQRPETQDFEAYEHYVRGRQFFHEFGVQSFIEAQKHFEKAIALDPEYAQAYCGLGSIHVFRYIPSNDLDELDKGIAYLQKSIELDPTYGEPYERLTYAYSRRGRLDEAIAAGHRAVELEPDEFMATYFLATTLALQASVEERPSLLDEALRWLTKTSEIEPRYQPQFQIAGIIHMLQGRYDQAEKRIDRACELEDPRKRVASHVVGARTMKANLLFRQGRIEEAEDLFRESLARLEKEDNLYRIPVTAFTHCCYGHLLQHQHRLSEALGEYRAADTILSENPSTTGAGYLLIKMFLGRVRVYRMMLMPAEERAAMQAALDLYENRQQHDYFWMWEIADMQAPYEIASAFAAMNQRENALEYLEKAVRCGWRDLPFLELDSAFDVMRTDTEYQQFIEELTAITAGA